MKLKNLLAFAGLSLMSLCLSNAWSVTILGGSTSSGGGAYVCRENGQITQAILHDLWEHDSRIFPVNRFPERSLQIVESDEPVEQQLSNALQKLRLADNLFAAKVERMLAHVQNENNWWLVPDDILIPTPADARSDYQPKNCPLEGMFLFHDESNSLAIKPELQMNLRNNTHIAAAWMHEAIYKVLRNPHIYSGSSTEHNLYEMNSSYPARKLNACLFSNNTFDSKCLGETLEIPTDAQWECNGEGIKFYLSQKHPDSENYELTLRKFKDKQIRAQTIDDMYIPCGDQSYNYHQITTAITQFSPIKNGLNYKYMYGQIYYPGIHCDNRREKPIDPLTISLSISDSETGHYHQLKAVCQEL